MAGKAFSGYPDSFQNRHNSVLLKLLLWCMLVLVLTGGIFCAASADRLAAPVVTIIPDNPDSASFIIFRFDQVYDEVKFGLYQGDERITGGQDCLDGTDFDWGPLETGSWRIEAQARMGDTWSEKFVMEFTVEQAPILEAPVILSCPDSVTVGQTISVEFEVDENADWYSLALLDSKRNVLGFDNPEEPGVVEFNDWPDDIEPGTYTFRLNAAANEGYDDSNAYTYWPVTVTAGERPAAPENVTILVNDEETDTLAVGDRYTLRVSAAGADAVRWEYSSADNSDHGRAKAVDVNGAADFNLALYSWMASPEIEYSVYARLNGVWSLPLKKTVSVAGITVSGTVGFTLSPASPKETNDLIIYLDRDYEKFIGELIREGKTVRTVTDYWSETIYLGTLEAGDYTLTGRGYDDGVWTEKSSVSFTVTEVERLDTPVIVTAPESVRIGENFTVTFTADERTRYSTLFLYDPSGKYIGFENSDSGTLSFCRWPDNCIPGEYTGQLISFADDLGDSLPAEFTLTVTEGNRPEAPHITLSPEQPVINNPIVFIFDQEYEAIAIEIYRGNGSRYSGTSEENTDRYSWWRLSEGSWIVKASVCVDGIWSTWSETPFTVIDNSPRPVLYLPEEIIAGVPFSADMEETDNILFYGVEILDSSGRHIDENVIDSYEGIELCALGSTSLDAGTYYADPWITSDSNSYSGDPVPFTVTGTRPDAPSCTVPASVCVDEDFSITCNEEEAEQYEIRICPAEDKQPSFYRVSESSQWDAISLPASGDYTVEVWCLINGQWTQPMTANITAVALGTLPDPVITGRTAYDEGDDLSFTFTAEGADQFEYIIAKGGIYWGKSGSISAGSVLTISTSGSSFYEAGGYSLTVRSCKAGWDSGETQLFFTIGDAPAVPVLTVSKNPVQVNEHFWITIDMDDIDSFVCDVQYDPSDPDSIGGYGGDSSHDETEWYFELPGRHFIRVYSIKDGIYSAWAYIYVDVVEETPGPDPQIELTHSFLYEGEVLRGRLKDYDSSIEYALYVMNGEGQFCGLCSSDSFGSDGRFVITSEAAQSDAPVAGDGFAEDTDYQLVVSTKNEDDDDNSWTICKVLTFDVLALPAARDTLVLPEDTLTVQQEAFAGTAAERVVIPSGCETVGNRAFAGCSELLIVEVNGDDTEISPDAFAESGVEILFAPEGSMAETRFAEILHVIH